MCARLTIRSRSSYQRFEITEVIDQVRRLNEPLAAKKEITLERTGGDRLEPVEGDRDKIKHVLANLIGNAIKFTPEGGRVWISAERKADEILVEVGDTGGGIAAENHELVFREFAQVDSSPSRPHHGTGLGLAIARRLIDLHSGRIWVESELGRGSRFSSRFRPRTSRIEVAAHILVVEDSQLVTSAFRILLEDAGYRVSIAESVKEMLVVRGKRKGRPDAARPDSPRRQRPRRARGADGARRRSPASRWR